MLARSGGEAWGMLEDNLSTGDWLHPEHRDGSCSLYKEGKDLLSQGRRARGRALIYKRGQQVSKKAVPLVRGFCAILGTKQGMEGGAGRDMISTLGAWKLD